MSYDSYRFVYQEWDMMRERYTAPEERLEKLPAISQRQMSFAMQLQESRIKQRLTIQELAVKCKLPARTLALYESGSEIPPSDVAKTIREILDMESS